ncbi:hypothetical protein TH9_05465 [Thalassospira xiamenensis]|uniref:hypothetical protein n=1 Tax=Thalassospira xiamenensis TaxID=220697 RepID=UPI000DEDF90B|nr:hypothetical protein [Thalassospira xiamenensis]RCK36100.1 hypothetical protein TH9_05465 [Thalassospira xiamenensis]
MTNFTVGTDNDVIISSDDGKQSVSLKIGDSGELLINGQRAVVKNELRLSRTQAVFGIIAAISATLAAIASVIDFLIKSFGCLAG